MSLFDAPDPTKTMLGARMQDLSMVHCPGCGRLESVETPPALPLRARIAGHLARVILNGVWVVRTPKGLCPGSNYLVPETNLRCSGCKRPCLNPDQWCFICNCCIWCDDIDTERRRGDDDHPCSEAVSKVKLWSTADAD